MPRRTLTSKEARRMHAQRGGQASAAAAKERGYPQLIQSHIKALNALGYSVQLTPISHVVARVSALLDSVTQR